MLSTELTLSAVPISSLTASGTPSKSFFADPTQNSGFSPGALFGRAISIIPVLGYKSTSISKSHR
jgi:hypothetical protein